jgi:hypothetical protein
VRLGSWSYTKWLWQCLADYWAFTVTFLQHYLLAEEWKSTEVEYTRGVFLHRKEQFDYRIKLLKGGYFIYKPTMTSIRPQAIGYGLNDSPIGLAAWLLCIPVFSNWSYGK